MGWQEEKKKPCAHKASPNPILTNQNLTLAAFVASEVTAHRLSQKQGQDRRVRRASSFVRAGLTPEAFPTCHHLPQRGCSGR